MTTSIEGSGWVDGLREALAGRGPERAGNGDFTRFAEAFPLSYRVMHAPDQALADIERVRALDDGADLATGFTTEAAGDDVRFVVVSPRPISLSAVLPTFERLGVEVSDERAYEVRPAGGEPRWLHDFGIQCSAPLPPPVRAEFRRTFEAAWNGTIENDGFNRLVVAGRLTAAQVTVLRAYARYLRQIRSTFSQPYVEEVLAHNAALVRQIVDLFETRFDPDFDGNRTLEEAGIAAEITEGLDRVPSLDEDRILRSFLTLVQATVRTSTFQAAEEPSVAAFKFDPTAIGDLPSPRPVHEIWVYSPRVEGVHLRGGPIARGGIRWSDRREDFRTEILGLMKAQMVKNAVIVPTGAKGGFVVKRPPADRSALGTEVLACYESFVGGLLSITDNVVADAVVPPPRVVRYDGDDPYLVVAADKGTATFSDLANQVAARHGYWLGDAFASGGSEGFDHKAMGITARGVWESARRHFLGLGVDVDTQPITCVGIGDMSGDVFGNGMLRSAHLRLVAAFDHRHVFIDPAPDAARSFAERRRLFELPGSSWADYDPALISEGGGVWPRTAKKIALCDAARDVLGTAASVLTPGEVVSAILRAPVDLLWNGGIGTYVKAAAEANADVGDRANDGVRVNATDLRCRVVVEGGNLGFTQAGRIEYALAGGLINNDAIDNSAGVDTSDHEVNIKILLDGAEAAGEITAAQRHELLQSVVEDVADAVLEDNRAQTLALAVARAQAPSMLDVHARFLRALEHDSCIDRVLDCLPTAKQLAERHAAGLGLTTPELAVLLAHTKLALVDDVLASDLPDTAEVQSELAAYFPPGLQDRFAARLGLHRLRREIVATRLVNEIVNMAGMTFEYRMAEETGAAAADVLRAAVVARAVLGVPEQWHAIRALDGRVGADVQIDLLLQLRRMTERSVLWLLRHRRPPVPIGATVAAFAAGAAELCEQLPLLATGAHASAVAEARDRALAAGVPADLANCTAAWPYLHTSFDIVEVARARGRTVTDAARAYWDLFERLDVEWLWDRVSGLPRGDRWQAHARAGLRDDLLEALRALTDDALRAGDVFTASDGLVERWLGTNSRGVERLRAVLGEIRAGGVFDVTTISVAVRQLHNLVQGSTLVPRRLDT